MSETIPAYPKIQAIGHRHIRDIFSTPVWIEEKVDGSQFSFMFKDGQLYCKSKNKMLEIDCPEKMFARGVEYLKTIDIPEGIVFYCEYLDKPKHNVLAYDRIPENHFVLFGAYNIEQQIHISPLHLGTFARELGIERVPQLFFGKVSGPEELKENLNHVSFLGGQKIEGVVVKNYNLESEFYPILIGKFVSEKFKEVARPMWKQKNTGKGKLETLFESYRTTARWDKAIIHLREQGLIEDSPKDIGGIMKEVQRDIEDEEKENIKERLWAMFEGDLKRAALKGFPQWYKDKLMSESF